MVASSRAAISSSCSIRKRKCSCRTAISRAPARAAARPTSTATTARTAAPPTRRPTCSSPTRWSPARPPCCAIRSTSSSNCPSSTRCCATGSPVGYLASFKALCDRTNLKFDDFLAPSSRAEMHHFIGKDIINFHGLFWPAMLHGAGFRTPTALHVNGYLTVNGAKMSKSRGTFIQARTYLDVGLNPEFLRYYFASMLDDAPVDVDLDLKAFEERVNSHLVGKWVNIASRTAGFMHKFFEGRLATRFGTAEQTLWNTLLEHYDGIDALYDAGDFAEVTRRFVLMADLVNGHIAATAPWAMAKDESRRAELHHVCSFAIAAFRLLAGLLKPILPATVAAAEAFLNAPIADFDDARAELHNHAIGPFEPLLGRIDPKRIEAMIDASKESLSPAPAAASTSSKENRKPMTEPAAPAPNQSSDTAAIVSIDDFAKLDLRIGKVVTCEFVE